MATLQETIEAIQKLSNGSNGISLSYDAVVKESIENYLKQQGISYTKEDIEKIKKEDYDSNTRTKAYFTAKIAQFKVKTSAAIDGIKNIPEEFAGITTTAANPYASTAAIPMKVNIKNSVSSISGHLSDALTACSDMGISAPDSVVSLVDKVANIKSLVGL